MVFAEKRTKPDRTSEKNEKKGVFEMLLPAKLKVALIIAIIFFFAVVLSLLKNKRLALKYTLLWLLTGVIMLILVLFPGIMLWAAESVGIQSNMNALYIFLIAFLIIITMSLTSIVSRQSDRIRKLVQTQGLMEKRIRENEQDMKELLMNREEKRS